MATRSSPEVYLISAILRTGDITTALQAGIDAEQFHACRNEWTWLTDYLIDRGCRFAHGRGGTVPGTSRVVP